MVRRLPEGWKSHGGFWRYKENPMGGSVESVIQFTEHGQKRYEAHYWDNKCCGFANSAMDFWKTKKFDSREEAFAFCEEKYRQRMESKG